MFVSIKSSPLPGRFGPGAPRRRRLCLAKMDDKDAIGSVRVPGEGGTISLHGGKGAYKGISGKLSVSGKIFAVLPRLKNGKCNEANNAVPVEVLGEITGSGKVTLGS